MAKVIYKLGDDISTDILYPGRYMATVLPSETPQFAFADLPELNKLLTEQVNPGSNAIVAGKNFGCGSSREQAVSTLKGHEVTVVARDLARIFMQNSINLGLRTVICPDIQAEPGDELEISDEMVLNKSTGKSFPITPLPAARQAIVEAGGLIPYARRKLLEERI
jgi:3-isopropylmalate/(R)-2-methylmalate dehydratase small subunit